MVFGGYVMTSVWSLWSPCFDLCYALVSGHVADQMDRDDPGYIEALEKETSILEKRVDACRSRIMLVTCFDISVWWRSRIMLVTCFDISVWWRHNLSLWWNIDETSQYNTEAHELTSVSDHMMTSLVVTVTYISASMYIEPILVSCWASFADGCSALSRNWFDVSGLLVCTISSGTSQSNHMVCQQYSIQLWRHKLSVIPPSYLVPVWRQN